MQQLQERLRMARAILFDLNGTLSDDLILAYGAVRGMFEAFKTPCPTLKEYREEVTSDYMQFFAKRMPPEFTREIQHQLRGDFMLKNWNLGHLREDAPFIVFFAKAISGLKTAIVTAERKEHLLRRIGLGLIYKYTDLLVPDASPKKPFLVETAKQLGVQPERCLLVEDSVEGIKIGQELGMITVGLKNPTAYCPEEIMESLMPDILIGELSQLSLFILRSNQP